MKNRIQVVIAALLAASVFSGCSSTGTGTGSAYERPTGQTAYKSGLSERWRVGGTQRPVTYAETPAPAPAPAPRPAPAPPVQVAQAPAPRPAVRQNCSEATTGLIRMSKTMPAEAQLGEPFQYELNATATQCAGNIVITDQVPAGAAYVRSEPAAEVQGDRLVWRINQLDGNESRNIKVWLRAEREGNLASCAMVQAEPRVCAGTFVGKPALAIRKTGPETATLGSDVTYQVVVQNTGNAVAKDVVVTDQVPAGLTAPNGQSTLTFNLGNLNPNESKTIPVTLKASQRGRHCNNAVAQSSNAGRVQAEACTLVQQPGLKIAKSGDPEQFINRNARYRIVVQNTGDTTLTGVTVTDTAPSPTRIVSASGASVSGNTATWNVGSMNAGEEKSFEVVLTSPQGGRYCNGAAVASAQGLRDSAEACTVWKGLGAVLLEVVDDPDPNQVGESTTYTIRVTNQGTADLTNIRTAAEFDAECKPTSSPEGTVSGQNVSFPNVARLAPKASFTYTIKVQGVKAGDARNKVNIICDQITRPVVEEESTTVY